MSVARDEGFAFDMPVGSVVVGAALATVFVSALPGAFALLAAEAVVFTAGFATDLSAAGLVAAEVAFFAETVEFAVFFIAFAMESIPSGLLSCAE
ncbi:hypothetical protein [Noviherbaspirillum sp. Root189]|uniref:hypothetical protein n=1 Tax=Noviherbaspirillum sp. Root189 TaxID=1736487 RepID=UPI001F1F121C|nr:hypothetical protein [Noviherbaspirillum sp. Root189]